MPSAPNPPPPSPSVLVPVCGIGASAGGVEALQQFFTSVPADLGLAFVVIVHLAPDRKSELPSIISRWTKMTVIQVVDHERETLKPNTIYVIAPDRKLEITDSSVGASNFEQPRGRRTAIDLFFRSLAEARSEGFAVVLSGSGSDGALGAKAIKEHGGVVLVQDPEEAGHGEMPGAVIATGAADLVLPLPQLVQALTSLVRNKSLLSVALRSADPGESIGNDEARALKGVLDLLRQRTGHDFSKYKRATVLRRLSRRMQLNHHLTIAEYLQHLRTEPAEAQALLNDLLISVTTFFRDPEAWIALQALVERLIDNAEDGEQIRAWTVGCATGEEAYSLAILFAEAFERRQTHRNLIIFASDVDENALAHAREGLYPAAIEADVSESRLARYFRAEDEHYRVSSEIRDCVVFATHNILRDPPFSRLHLITCRNLLIYLNRDLQEQVISIFRYTCRDQGYLFLGASETADEDQFAAIDKKHRIFTPQPRSDGGGTLPELLAAPATRFARMVREAQPATRASGSELHLAMLESMAPPSVVVDERWNVVHLSGTVARFFQQSAGVPARRVTDLARPELRDELHAALHRAGEQTDPVLSAFVAVKFGTSQRRIAVLAQKRAQPVDGRTHILVTFLDGGEAGSENIAPENEASDELVRELREKLRTADQRIEGMREDHYATNEDLRAANEELQSLNEEYRSTTEELETSKEELQSINEELQTVNNELRLKFDEVSRAHSDLENLMGSTDVATLFLDRELRIKRFTPKLGDIFNIKPRDHDRPIGDLTHALDYPSLESDAARVLREMAPIECTVNSRAGQVFIARLRPYRVAGGREIDGVVITFLDVSALKKAEAALRTSEQRLANELDVLRRLHQLTLSVATASAMGDALERILDAAIELHGAHSGDLRLFSPDKQQLRIVAQRGFDAESLEQVTEVASEAPSASIRALQTRQVCRIENIHSDPSYATQRLAALQGSFRAVQSMPLLGRGGPPLGVLSVYFLEPHIFTERDKQIADLLAQPAAALIESRAQQDSLAALNKVLQERSAELEESQKRLSVQTEELVAQDRNRDDFLSALGHELRNPLAAINNSLAVMTAGDDRSRRALAIFERQVKNLTRLVNDLLDSTRVKHGRLRLEYQPVDLGQSVTGALETVRALALAKHIALEFSPPPAPIIVDADPDRLAQILDNILRNAVTYTDDGSVALTLTSSDGFARVTVRDTGVGIDPRDATELFKPYEQRDHGGRSKGLGLGLTLAKAMVEGHGGKIGFESDGVGKGSTFWFTLPLAKRVPNAKRKVAGPPATRRRILVVDDNRDVAESTKVLFEHLGQTVQIAFDGESALALARDFRPQIAVLDLSMAGMSGTELARQLRELYPEQDLTLIAFTGRSDAESSARASGFQHFLIKPLDHEAVGALLNSLAPGT